MKVAVTGGAGFIGRRVCDWLSAAGHVPLVYDHTNGYDVAVPTFTEHAVDHVIHLAGVLGTDELFDHPNRAVLVNVMGTVNVLEWCRQVGAGYTGITMPDAFPSVYSATKIAAQRMATAFHHTYDLPVSHVRAFNAYGPGQAHGPHHPRKIIPSFSDEAWRGRPITVWGDGTQTVDLVHVDDVARMLVDAIGFGDDCVFDAGTGTDMAVVDVARFVNDVTGNTAGIWPMPMRRGEPEHTHIQAEGEGWERLDWRPTLDLGDLAATVATYQPSEVAA